MNFTDELDYRLKRILRKRILEMRRRRCDFDKYKCIFIHVPKTAGVSVAKSLLGKPTVHWSALNCRLIFGKEDFNNYFKFSFVRNPFTRLISAYEFLRNGGYGPSDKMIVTIEEFNAGS